MRVIEVVYNGKVNQVPFPTSYYDLTFEQFLKLRRDFDGTASLLEILTGIERLAWLNMTPAIASSIMPLLDWVSNKIDWNKIPVPKEITVGNLTFQVPSDLGMKTFGQKITLETKVSKAMEEKIDLFQIMPDAMAIYFQPQLDNGLFDDSRLNYYREVFMKCRAVDVYPIATFFLRTSDAYRNFGKIPSEPQNQASQGGSKKKQGSKLLKKIMGIFSSSTR